MCWFRRAVHGEGRLANIIARQYSRQDAVLSVPLQVLADTSAVTIEKSCSYSRAVAPLTCSLCCHHPRKQTTTMMSIDDAARTLSEGYVSRGSRHHRSRPNKSDSRSSDTSPPADPPKTQRQQRRRHHSLERPAVHHQGMVPTNSHLVVLVISA